MTRSPDNSVLETNKERYKRRIDNSTQKAMSGLELDLLKDSIDSDSQKLEYSNDNLSRVLEENPLSSFYTIEELRKGNGYAKVEDIKFKDKRALRNIGLGDLMPSEVRSVEVWDHHKKRLGIATRNGVTGGFYYKNGRYAKILTGYSFQVSDALNKTETQQLVEEKTEAYDVLHKIQYEDVVEGRTETKEKKELELIYTIGQRYGIDPCFILAFKDQCHDASVFGVPVLESEPYIIKLNLFCRRIQHFMNNTAFNKRAVDADGNMTASFLSAFVKKYMPSGKQNKTTISEIQRSYENLIQKDLKESYQSPQEKKERQMTEQEIIDAVNATIGPKFWGIFPDDADTLEEASEEIQEYLEDERDAVTALVLKYASKRMINKKPIEIAQRIELMQSEKNKIKAYLFQKHVEFLEKNNIDPNNKETGRPFFKMAQSIAQDIERIYGIPWKVTVAQTLLETGHGKSALSDKTNNFFGIKDFSGKGVQHLTQEFYGQYTNVEAPFRSYDRMVDSFYDYAQKITQEDRYKSILKNFKAGNITSSEMFLSKIIDAGYATDPKYIQKATNALGRYGVALQDSIRFHDIQRVDIDAVYDKTADRLESELSEAKKQKEDRERIEKYKYIEKLSQQIVRLRRADQQERVVPFALQNRESVETVTRNVSLRQGLRLLEDRTPHLYDENGNLIIYNVGVSSGTEVSTHNTAKEFIAVHGTAAGNIDSITELNADKSGLRTLYKRGVVAYMVAKNGMVFQFFHETRATGGINTAHTTKIMNDRQFNRRTIGIEMSARGVKNKKGNIIGVEQPNTAQVETGSKLIRMLQKSYKIPQKHLITSADAVRNIDTPFSSGYMEVWPVGNFVRGAHVDDFTDEARAQLGMHSTEQVRKTLVGYRNEKSKNSRMFIAKSSEEKKTNT